MKNDKENASAYPLQWPAGWPRTPEDERRYGRFSTKGQTNYGWQRTNDITISQALARINSELESFDGPQRNWKRINPVKTVVSTNLRVRRNDGQPASSQKSPEDPGVAVYFEMDGKPQCIPCDAYTTVAQNLAAVAATLSALRTLERHGSGLMERAFTGFQALPDPNKVNWRDVLDYRGDDLAECRKAYRRAAHNAHPDHGGSNEQMAIVNKAWGQAKEEL